MATPSAAPAAPQAAQRAFDDGDFAALRRMSAADPRALEPRLRAAVTVDPAMIAALALCAAAFVAAATAYLR